MENSLSLPGLGNRNVSFPVVEGGHLSKGVLSQFSGRKGEIRIPSICCFPSDFSSKTILMLEWHILERDILPPFNMNQKNMIFLCVNI